MFQREIRAPIWALIFLTAGGWLLHLRIHPPAEAALFWIPAIIGGFNLFILPLLFDRRGTAPAAWTINMLTVVIGTIGMAYYSATNWRVPVTVGSIIMRSTLADILILLARLPLAEVIMMHYHESDDGPERQRTPESAGLDAGQAPPPREVEVARVQPPSPASRGLLRAVFVLAFLGLLALAAWMSLRHYGRTFDAIGSPDAQIITAGRLTAMLATVLIIVQFALSARIRALDMAFGLDRILRYHRYTGASAAVLGTLHPALLFATKYYDLGQAGLAQWAEALGGAGLAAIYVIGVTSLWRKAIGLSYEAWHRVHFLGFVVVILVAVHSLALGSDLQGGWPMWVWVGLISAYGVLFVWTRLVRPALIARRPFRVAAVTPVSHDTWQIDLEPAGHDGIRQLPGQFAFLTLHRAGHRDERHPFTISSPPRRDGAVAHTIKQSGDFTATVGGTRAGDTATVEGPYGQFCHLLHAPDADLLMIAGGVGITPMLSMLRSMAADGDERRITLIWGNRTEGDVLYRDEIQALQGQLPGLRVVHVLSRQDDFAGETGYVDEALLRRVLEDADLRAQVFLCGPPAMMDMVARALRRMGVPGARIHSERFEL